jgi:glycosyltransferase involved in cell wall biosynthesis
VLNAEGLFASSVESYSDLTVYRQPTTFLPMRYFYLWASLCLYSAKRIFHKILTDWGKPDILHAHVVLPGGWLATKLGQRYSIPVVLTEHSGPFSMHLQSGRQASLVGDTLRDASKVIAVSAVLADQIRSFRPEGQVSIVGNVIRADYFVPKETRKEAGRQGMRFLSVALLHANKGIDILLQAVRLLIGRRINRFELLIIGEGPVGPQLRRLAADLGIADRCLFLGMLDRERVKYWMQHCDVFILPSLGETFGVVLGEAMACGKPVIATRCGGPEFIVTPEAGLLVEPGSATALADAMEKFLSGEVWFDSREVRNCIVKRFGEEIFLDKIGAVYRHLWKEE